MRILLFDMHDNGHHLEYASMLQSKLSRRLPESKIHFLTLREREKHNQYFKKGCVKYLYMKDDQVPDVNAKGLFEYAGQLVNTPRDTIVKKVIYFANKRDYNILHLLHLDDITKEVLKHGIESDIKVLGNINGAYFKFQNRYTGRVERVLNRSGIGGISRIVPSPICRMGPWSSLNLSHAIQEDILADVFVPTQAGRENILKSIKPTTASVPIIPDPIETWFDGLHYEKNPREELGIPPDEFVILFFGEMRLEKGPDVLLEALESYRGEPMTAIFAGRPVGIDPREIAVDNHRVDLRTELEYIPQADVPAYFLASNTVVLPYRRSFGEYRPSGVFQKACGAVRPLVAPRFGTFEERVSTWELGLMFKPGSANSLRQTLEEIREDSEAAYNAKSMKEYASTQTFENMADITAKKYKALLC